MKVFVTGCTYISDQYANLVFKRYETGQIAMLLIAEDGTQLAHITRHVPGQDIRYKQVVIKDYSENKGLLQTLIDNRIVSLPRKTIRVGFTELHVCDLEVEPQ